MKPPSFPAAIVSGLPRSSMLSSRYLILVAAFGMQLCLGATYSWSVYVGPLRALTGYSQGPAQLPFSVFYIVFPATMLISGTLLGRMGPRRCAVAGGVLFGGGWLFASLGRHHFGFTVAGIGALGGIGVGLAYIVPIATCIRWFPKNKGLVTGIAVAGFGGGAALVSKAGGRMMTLGGMTPFEVFAWLGAAFLAVVVVSGMAMRNPSGTGARETGILALGSVVCAPAFWILYGAMFAGLTAGFAVNANLKELSRAADSAAGVNAVAFFAVANAAGRICWGLVFDRARSGTAITANLLAQALLLCGAPWILRSAAGLQAFAFAAGFNYGGILVLYASTAARTWGGENVGRVYGWLFSANIPAALAPVVAGFAYDAWGSFTVPLMVIAAALFLASGVVTASRGKLDQAAAAV